MNNQLDKNTRLYFKNGSLTFEELTSFLNTLPFEVLFIDITGKIKLIIHPLDKDLQINQRISSHTFFKNLPPTFEFLEKLKHGKNTIISRALKINQMYYNVSFIAVYNSSHKYIGCLQISENITEVIQKYRYGGFIESEMQTKQDNPQNFHYQKNSDEKYRQQIENEIIEINNDDDYDSISGASEL